MPCSRRGRWFRFSLRTLFAIITLAGVFGGWLRWNYDFIQQRRAVMKSMVHSGFRLYEDRPGFNGFGGIAVAFKVEQEVPRVPPQIPWVRTWLGDVPVGWITVKDQSRAIELKPLFPEANIHYADHAYHELLKRRERPWAY